MWFRGALLWLLWCNMIVQFIRMFCFFCADVFVSVNLSKKHMQCELFSHQTVASCKLVFCISILEPRVSVRTVGYFCLGILHSVVTGLDGSYCLFLFYVCARAVLECCAHRHELIHACVWSVLVCLFHRTPSYIRLPSTLPLDHLTYIVWLRICPAFHVT